MPELPEEYREFCEAQYKTARFLLEKDEHVLSVFFVRIGKTDDAEFKDSEGGFITIPLLCDDKDIVAMMVKAASVRANSPLVVMIGECWSTAVDEVNPGQTPEKKEAVIVTAETADGDWMSLAEITRDSDGKPHIVETMPPMDGGEKCGGRFSGMVSPREDAKMSDLDRMFRNVVL